MTSYVPYSSLQKLKDHNREKDFGSQGIRTRDIRMKRESAYLLCSYEDNIIKNQ